MTKMTDRFGMPLDDKLVIVWPWPSGSLKEYRNMVAEHIPELAGDKPRQFWVMCHPPDKRKRSLEKIEKVVLGTLHSTKMMNNSCRINEIRFNSMTKGGKIIIYIANLL